jgi:3-dehydroquinate dehydratase / shikimate dehydrogenase
MRLCIPIIGPSDEEIEDQLRRAAPLTDLVELRLDLFDHLNPEAWAFAGERIFKCLTREQLTHAGGADILDLELPLAKEAPSGVPLLISDHSRDGTFERLKQVPAQFYKLATPVEGTLPALRMALAARGQIGITGELCSRLLAPLIDSPWTYAALDESCRSAPGQPTWDLLHNIYKLDTKGPDTRLYGLLGDPVSKSRGYIHHNARFGPEGIYIPFRLRPEELGEALELLEQLNLTGLSVTMPLKEAIVDYLETDLGAVNTVTVRDGRRFGSNTDGPAVLDAIEERLPARGKQLVILGAGGAARAIAHEAQVRGAEVTVLNRHPERAAKLSPKYGSLSDVVPCDILVQATPVDPPVFGHPKVALDVVNAATTPWLERATALGATPITGEEMWQRQAELQRQHWGIS